MRIIPVRMSLHNVTSMLCPLKEMGSTSPPSESNLDHVTCSGQQDISKHATSRASKCLPTQVYPLAARNLETTWEDAQTNPLKGETSAIPAAPQTCEQGHLGPP